MVMEVEDLVEAALVGFDRREAVTIPSLPDAADWQALMTARARLAPICRGSGRPSATSAEALALHLLQQLLARRFQYPLRQRLILTLRGQLQRADQRSEQQHGALACVLALRAASIIARRLRTMLSVVGLGVPRWPSSADRVGNGHRRRGYRGDAATGTALSAAPAVVPPPPGAR